MPGTWRGTVVRQDKAWSLRFTAWDLDGAFRVCFDFPDYGLYYRCTTDVESTGDTLRLRYVSGRETVTLEGSLKSGRFSGRWNGLGVDAEFNLERTGDAGAPLIEEPVTFKNADVSLAGTLIRPNSTAPIPAIVWTHGSGRQTRSEDFYRDRGYLLAQNGIAAFIYDKRGSGESGGDPDATLDELAGDAVAAVQALQSRPDIMRDRVGIGGFSQGGYVAPLAASRYGRIAFVIVGAAPGVTPAEQNEFAANRMLQRRGLAVADVDRAMQLYRRVATAQRTGEGLEEAQTELDAARKEPWFSVAGLPTTPLKAYGRRGLSVLQFDPRKAWERVSVPVLAVWGADDALVPVETSKQRIESWLRAAGNQRTTTLVFPAAGHGLAVTGARGVFDWPRLAPGFHDTMVKWIVKHATVTPTR